MNYILVSLGLHHVFMHMLYITTVTTVTCNKDTVKWSVDVYCLIHMMIMNMIMNMMVCFSLWPERQTTRIVRSSPEETWVFYSDLVLISVIVVLIDWLCVVLISDLRRDWLCVVLLFSSPASSGSGLSGQKCFRSPGKVLDIWSVQKCVFSDWVCVCFRVWAPWLKTRMTLCTCSRLTRRLARSSSNPRQDTVHSRVRFTVHSHAIPKSGVRTFHATHRDLLLTGYVHVQTHSFF